MFTVSCEPNAIFPTFLRYRVAPRCNVAAFLPLFVDESSTVNSYLAYIRGMGIAPTTLARRGCDQRHS